MKTHSTPLFWFFYCIQNKYEENRSMMLVPWSLWSALWDQDLLSFGLSQDEVNSFWINLTLFKYQSVIPSYLLLKAHVPLKSQSPSQQPFRPTSGFWKPWRSSATLFRQTRWKQSHWRGWRVLWHSLRMKCMLYICSVDLKHHRISI